MKKLFITLALLLATAAAALAYGQYYVVEVTYDPYTRTIVAGPFDTYSDCLSVANAQYVPGAHFSCEMH
jgi:hypothetical protein